MNDNDDITHAGVGDDDVVQTFQLETSDLRGRVVRLGGVMDAVLNAHAYPPAVARLTAEVMTLCALLSSMLKYKGVFTLQVKGDGAVSMLLADMTSDGDLRACTTFEEDGLPDIGALPDVVGKGYMVFTVQPEEGSDAEPYQGIVSLDGASLLECVQHYFNQSEQIDTGIEMAVGEVDGHWRSGAVMLQRMPDEGGEARERGVKISASDEEEDYWRRGLAFLESVSDKELLDADLHSHELLHRLFHEDGVRVYEPQDVRKGCRCSEDKVARVVATLSEEDLEHITKDGKVEMVCEFCSKTWSVGRG